MRHSNAKCIRCGKDFYARPSFIKKGWGKYCSISCGKLRVKYPILKNCLLCGEQFIIADGSYSKKKYCSSSCAAKLNNKSRKGIKYKGKRSAKKYLISKYGHVCMIPNCNYAVTLDIHHIKYRSKGGDNDFGNCLLLCPNHHREVHLKKIRAEELINILEKIQEVCDNGIQPDSKLGALHRVEGSIPSASAVFYG